MVGLVTIEITSFPFFVKAEERPGRVVGDEERVDCLVSSFVWVFGCLWLSLALFVPFWLFLLLSVGLSVFYLWFSLSLSLVLCLSLCLRLLVWFSLSLSVFSSSLSVYLSHTHMQGTYVISRSTEIRVIKKILKLF